MNTKAIAWKVQVTHLNENETLYVQNDEGIEFEKLGSSKSSNNLPHQSLYRN